VCGESIDINGNTIIAGSYSIQDNLTQWDLRMHKKIQTIDWFDTNFERNDEG